MITGAHAVLFSSDADADRGWGLVTAIELPSGAELALYEPRHPTP